MSKAEYQAICFAATLTPLVYSCGAHLNSMVVLSELTGLILRNELLEWERIYDTVGLHLKFLEQ